MRFPSMQLLTDAVGAAARSGLLEPGLSVATVAAAGRWGASSATPWAAGALRHPTRTALVDHIGTLSYRELDRRSSEVAGALRTTGVDRTTTIGIVCRNHRGFIEANLAAAKLGARVVYLNTGLAPAQLGAVIGNEGVDVVLGDEEYADAITASVADHVPVAPDASWSFPSLERDVRLPWQLPGAAPDTVILTSGTTGTPKGAPRPMRAGDAAAAIGILGRLPHRTGDVAVVAAPLFHAWGLSQHTLTATLAGTVVLSPRFDPQRTLDLVDQHRAQTLVVVPTMLRRMLDADAVADTSSLTAVVSSGSALPAGLAKAWMDRHGDTLFNFYGSTEVGQVTIADPADLRAAPGTAGRAAPGVEVRILDDDHQPVPAGVTGRILVAGSAAFDGYTSGDTKPVLDDAMEIGDTGHLDAEGRLFVDGRVDDMIISGGENLYPQAIEDALADHPRIAEVAVVGVPDDDLGQRVRAVLVARGAGRRPSAATLREHASLTLAAHEVPREFVFVDELPRNETGKILRRTLQES